MFIINSLQFLQLVKKPTPFSNEYKYKPKINQWRHRN